MIIDLFACAEFNDASQIHDRDAVAKMSDDTQVMRNEQIGQIEFPLQLHQQVQDLGLNRNIQSRDRFIGNNQLRTQRQRPGNTDTLPLASTELMRIPIEVILAQADEFQQLPDLGLPFSFGNDCHGLQKLRPQSAARSYEDSTKNRDLEI